MKKILVACGTGMATSTMIAEKVGEFLDGMSIDYSITQGRLDELAFNDGKFDLFITSMKVENDYETPVVSGTAFLIGMNEDKTKQEILKYLQD
ncbi:PTS sugar transporter subunit IIB [Maledivibacter halophilus]|uniref:PTS EIIB type-2 domain-containing protein n=1 Tax=Maledivibacter halophilus TaxID=36842 RepID=A0A1T5L075_9FIRM|nr:PTS sugar transporter subunit IIB [Maledivibacter halophilus]SKC69492.1 PTS system unknown substrate IIB component, Gat family (TC 4.A.5.1.3) [Maledivibacter halophilus]